MKNFLKIIATAILVIAFTNATYARLTNATTPAAMPAGNFDFQAALASSGNTESLVSASINAIPSASGNIAGSEFTSSVPVSKNDALQLSSNAINSLKASSHRINSHLSVNKASFGGVFTSHGLINTFLYSGLFLYIIINIVFLRWWHCIHIS